MISCVVVSIDLSSVACCAISWRMIGVVRVRGSFLSWLQCGGVLLIEVLLLQWGLGSVLQELFLQLVCS